MRYYEIVISKPGESAVFKRFTSFPNGQSDPGALNVIIDAYVYPFAIPASQTVIQIWGISLEDISQANNFTGYTINVYAGFQNGLPLNNPSQAGLILSGMIFQAFANWIGVDQTLDFVVTVGGSVANQTNNISFSWLAGTTLASALATTLTNGFPKIKQNINISPKLVLAHDEHGFYQSLQAFAQMLKPITQAAIGGTYPGVDIVLTPTQITAYDGSTQADPTTIAFQDLIGQPTWIDAQTLQFVCPMRADLTVGGYIAMPKGLLGNSSQAFGAPGAVTTTAASQPQARQQSVFSGVFLVVQCHHLGNFRAADGTAWVTVFNAVLVPKQP